MPTCAGAKLRVVLVVIVVLHVLWEKYTPRYGAQQESASSRWQGSGWLGWVGLKKVSVAVWDDSKSIPVAVGSSLWRCGARGTQQAASAPPSRWRA
jgi:hypothetical protein